MDRRYRFLLLLILLLGTTLRIHDLGSASFWYDEAKSFLDSEWVIAYVRLKVFHFIPFYFYNMLLWFWSKLVSNSEFMLRLLSAISGVASILAIYFLGKLLFNRKVGSITAFILAISPFHIYYSQEIRPYSLISLLTIMTVYFLKRALQTKRIVFWVSYVIFHLFNISLFPLTGLLLFAQIIFALFYRKKYQNLAKKWMVGYLTILLFLIAGSIILIILFFKNPNIKFIEVLASSISLKTLLFTLKNFSIGYNAEFSIYLLATILFFLFFSFGIIKTVQKNAAREELILSLCCLFIPIFVMFGISTRVYADRYLIPSSIFLYLIVANGLFSHKKKYFIVSLTSIVILSAFALKNYYKGYLPGPAVEHIGVEPKKDHRAVASYIAENFHMGDRVFHICRNTIPSFIYYLYKYRKDICNMLIKDQEDISSENILYFGIDDEMIQSESIFYKHYKDIKDIICDIFNKKKEIPYSGKILHFINDEIMQFDYNVPLNCFLKSKRLPITEYKRIWLIFSDWNFETAKQPGSEQMRVVNWMDEHYVRTETKEFRGIIVYLYEGNVL